MGRADERTDQAVKLFLWIAGLSAAYSAAMFRGLEGHSGYSGCAFQVLYPGSFPGDTFTPANRPVLLSLYYGIVKLAGPIWLDDRFTFFFFMGMAALSLVALDKTVRLLGLKGRLERAAILAFILLERRFFIIHSVLVDNYGFSGTGLGAVAALWLLMGALAGWGAARQVPLIALCLAISLKNTWIPVFAASVLLWKERLGPAAKRWALLGACLAVAGGAATYALAIRSPDGSDVKLFDYILAKIDDAEANPFLYPAWANLCFVAFSLLAFLRLELPVETLRRIRVIAVIGLATWLLSGLYLTYAPDFMKVPYLVPFDPRRALRWPSYIVTVALVVALLKRVERGASRGSVWLSLAVFFGLYLLLHEEPRIKLVILAGSLLAAGLIRYRTLALERLQPRERLRLVAVPVLVGTLALYTVGALHQRREALVHLVRYGIVGDNLCAKWTGINEFFRERTSPSATVLALSMEDTHRRPSALHFDASLRTRTGRTMPMGHPAAFYLDYPKLQWWEERNRRMNEFVAAWEAQDPAAVSRGLAEFGPPDYLVIPTAKAGWAGPAAGLGYRVEARIGEFTIFRRNG